MASGSHSDVHLEELRERISWLIRLRWVATVGALATITLVPRVVGVGLWQGPLYVITGSLGGYNLVLWGISRWEPRVRRGAGLAYFANAQIGIDLAFLTVLLHFSGGIENPFVCYYVFHIVIASILLSRAATYLQVGVAMGLLVGMATLEGGGWVLHYRLGLVHEELYRSPTYVFAILFAVGTMLVFCAFMATSITGRLRHREGEIVKLSGSLREHADNLEEAYEALRALERGKSEYLNRVAHHLRSPLATLESVLAVIAEGRTGALSEKTGEMLGRARVRVRGMLDLARDLLVLSRAREAKSPAGWGKVEVGELVRAVAEEFRQQAEAGSVALVVEAGEGMGEVRGDGESLAELVENLISNALKYTPAGGRVEVRVEGVEAGVEVRVRDTGIGIGEEERERVWEEFYRGSGARESGEEGTGLGLSIVKAIAEMHGGEVGLESEQGVGTTFRVILPVEA